MSTLADSHTQSYLTRSPFIMPTDTGGKLAIAVTEREGSILNSTYTLFIAGIFSFVWDTVIFLVLMFYPTEMWPRKNTPTAPTEDEIRGVRRRKVNRYIALLSIANSATPLDSIQLLFTHARAMFFKVKDITAGSNDIFLIMVALLVAAGSKGAGVLLPSFLKIGNAAPPKPESVFYLIADPNSPDFLLESLGFQHLVAPATQRAMGTVESARQELTKYVHISDKTAMPWKGPSGEAIERITYDYKVTGLDFGLQLANSIDFILNVQGACTLEYGWFSASESDNISDVYDVYNTQIAVFTMGYARPVGGSIVPGTAAVAPNMSYAIIPDTVGRTSAGEGTDPWYKTTEPFELNNKTYFSVAGQRPVLSCWETNVWSYQGHTVDSVIKLEALSGLDLPLPIQNEILVARLSYPMIYRVASQLGNSILVSSSDAPGGVFNANLSSYAADLERLLFASYVSTRNIFLDTVLVNPGSTFGLRNSALDGSSTPKVGVNKFIIQGNEVVTLSVEVLVLVPLLLLFIWILRIAVIHLLPRSAHKLSRSTLQTVAFRPAQLYRILDEELCGFRDDWANRKGRVPFIKEARTEVIVAKASDAAGSDHDKRENLEKSPSTHGQEIENLENKDTSQVAAFSVLDTPVRGYPVFVEPRVVETSDKNLNLRFAGPLPDGKQGSHAEGEATKKWRDVADDPDHGKAKKGWFRRYFGRSEL